MFDRLRFGAALLALFVATGAIGSAQSATPYKLGLTWPLSGPLASSGQDYLPAVQIAVDHINRAGGVNGHPLLLIVEDSAGTAQGGVAAMRKLVQVDNVAAIMTLYTNVVAAQIPLADELKVPILGNIQTPGIMSRSPYSYSHAETVPGTANLFGSYWKNHRMKRIFAFLPNNALGPVFSSAYKAAAAYAGVEYAEASFTFGETDYRGVVARAKDFNADGVIVAAPGGLDGTVIIRQLRESGNKAQIFLPGTFIDEPGWRAGVAGYLEGMIMAGLEIDPVAGKAFIDDYRAKTGRYPSTYAAEAYDCVKMYAAAMQRGYDGDAIAKQLAVLKGVPSVLGGTITMDPDHYSVPATDALRQARGDKLVVVK